MSHRKVRQAVGSGCRWGERPAWMSFPTGTPEGLDGLRPLL